MTRPGPLLLFYFVVVAALMTGCPAHITPGRSMVAEVNFRGARNVDSDDLRSRIVTHETGLWPANRPRFLRWWRWWWVDPEYLDQAAVTRDQARLQRVYQARGYYDAHVAPPHVTDLGGTRSRVDFDVNEGQPTLVEDLRLRGCEPGDTDRLPDQICNNIRAALETSRGAIFDEDRFHFDRALIFDSLREGGYATPTVIPHAAVDPTTHRAWVEYTARSGPRSRFGVVTLRLSPSNEPFTADRLPNGLPVSVIRSSLNITEGQRYSRRALSDGQQALFDLGVFGIARLEEAPRPGGVVDVNVTLSTARLWRLRLGGGLEYDSVRSNVHLSASYEHRSLVCGFCRFRVEGRPLLYFVNLGSLIGGGSDTEHFSFVPGFSGVVELGRPEIFRRTAGLLTVGFEYAPDPLIPAIAFRRSLRVSAGLEHTFTRRWHGNAYLRFTDLDWSPNTVTDSQTAENNRQALQNDPIYSDLFFSQRYLHLEQSISYDSRDDRAHPTRGWYFAGNLMEGVRIPDVSDYTFLRGSVEGRAYVSPVRHIVFAFRAMVGGTVGSSYESNGRLYWPLPSDLRFVSGGSQSNRGYPYGRVGVLGTVPLTDPAGNGYRGANGSADRTTALGGTGIFEGSFETRWQPSNLGFVLFLDVSNVVGIDPQPFLNAQGQSTTCRPSSNNAVPDGDACRANPAGLSLPGPRGFNLDTVGALFSDLHPSVGVGVRYLTPIGPLRVDVAVRLNDLTCTRFDKDVATQNAAASSGYARYYVVTSPRCDFVGFDIPLALQFSLGEAY